MPSFRSMMPLALAAFIGAAGCDAGSDDGESDKPKVPFECTLGFPGTEGTPFVEHTSGSKAELELGFQGFLFFTVRLRAESPPAEVEAKFSAHLEGDAEPVGGSQPTVGFKTASSAGMVTDDILVFLPGGAVSAFVGRSAEVAVRVESAERTCLVTGTVKLVDDDPCIHTGDEPICPEGEGTRP